MRARSRVAWVRVLVLVGWAALATGCGLSTNDEPERIGTDSVVDETASAAAQPPTSQSPGVATTMRTVPVWFLENRDDGNVYLTPVDRQVPAPADADQRLNALIRDQPSRDERERDIATYVPEDTVVHDLELDHDGIMTVELSDSFYDQQGPSAAYAFAQVVFTLTAIGDVEEVLFVSDSEGALPVDGDGQTQTEALGRDDYASLQPQEADG